MWPTTQTDIWQAGIVHAPIACVLGSGSLADFAITWLPAQPDFCFLADPFGLWRDGQLHVFVEAYDYRDKHGVIRRYSYDRDFKLTGEGVALRAAHHLSYPYLIEDAGQVFMLPEAHHSGKLTLYKARTFPDVWEKVCDVMDVPAIDATVVRHGGKWWMFYALPGPNQREMRELHAASAPALTGPWQPHPKNPIHVSLESARPGGTPFAEGGALYIPTQDCSATYGGAVNVLRVDELSDSAFRCTPVRKFSPASIMTSFTDGLHTLSACGEVTLIDVKHIERSPRRILINWQRRWRRLAGRA
ncbi:MAG: hypothetical protein EXR11_02110 [Rhodospirillaceae bacterium]|nr:hypothetical protein [Rhodospirillaceae bacterium]